MNRYRTNSVLSHTVLPPSELADLAAMLLFLFLPFVECTVICQHNSRFVRTSSYVFGCPVYYTVRSGSFGLVPLTCVIFDDLIRPR